MHRFILWNAIALMVVAVAAATSFRLECARLGSPPLLAARPSPSGYHYPQSHRLNDMSLQSFSCDLDDLATEPTAVDVEIITAAPIRLLRNDLTESELHCLVSPGYSEGGDSSLWWRVPAVVQTSIIVHIRSQTSVDIMSVAVGLAGQWRELGGPHDRMVPAVVSPTNTRSTTKSTSVTNTPPRTLSMTKSNSRSVTAAPSVSPSAGASASSTPAPSASDSRSPPPLINPSSSSAAAGNGTSTEWYSTPTAIGAFIGSALALCLLTSLCCCVYCYWRKRRNDKGKELLTSPTDKQLTRSAAVEPSLSPVQQASSGAAISPLQSHQSSRMSPQWIMAPQPPPPPRDNTAAEEALFKAVATLIEVQKAQLEKGVSTDNNSTLTQLLTTLISEREMREAGAVSDSKGIPSNKRHSRRKNSTVQSASGSSDDSKRRSSKDNVMSSSRRRKPRKHSSSERSSSDDGDRRRNSTRRSSPSRQLRWRSSASRLRGRRDSFDDLLDDDDNPSPANPTRGRRGSSVVLSPLPNGGTAITVDGSVVQVMAPPQQQQQQVQQPWTQSQPPIAPTQTYSSPPPHWPQPAPPPPPQDPHQSEAVIRLEKELYRDYKHRTHEIKRLARTLEKRLDAQQLDMERMRSSPTRSLSPSRRDPEWPTEYDQFAPIDPLSHKRPVSPTVHHHYHPVVTEAVRPVSPLYGTDYEQQQATLQPPSQVVYMPAPPTVVQLPPPAVHYSDATAYPYPTSITSAEPSFVQPPSGYDASSSSSSRWYERDDGNRRTVSSRQQPVQGVMHSSPTHSRRSLVRDLDGDIDGGDVDDGWGTTDVTDVHPIQFQPPSEERREMRRQGKSRGRKSSTSAVGKRKWFWPPWGGKT